DRDFGLRFRRVFDTLWAARVLGWPRVGLASILEDRFDVQLDKRMQRTDWGRRPLNSAQLEYARLDTHFLLALRDEQEEALRERKRWREAQDVFAGFSDIRWEEKDPPTMWRLSGVNDLEPQQQAVLGSLFDWRETNAQRRDVPPFKVLRNESLMELAVVQPRTVDQVRQVKGVSNRLADRTANAILKAIQAGQRRQPPAPPERNHNQRPDDETLARYERLREWRTRTAETRGVDPDVVLTNQVLMEIARSKPADLASLTACKSLSPWKLDAYGVEIVAICENK
ncbi:MAG: HRDC domain-containing protein, partial [Caldilineales bacterium]|nr:HRDC domain-containing protein [Caldilineales bacterium]